VLYYHSNAVPSAVVGLCTVTREGYPDDSAFDRASEYFDEDSDRSAPMWYSVDIRADRKLARPVTLADIKATPALSEMALIRVSRLSVVPVTPAEWEQICRMGG
jgi:predicted RNA-binding protein with PUA-like domain